MIFRWKLAVLGGLVAIAFLAAGLIICRNSYRDTSGQNSAVSVSASLSTSNGKSSLTKLKTYRPVSLNSDLDMFLNSAAPYPKRMAGAHQTTRVYAQVDIEAVHSVMANTSEPLAIRNTAINLFRRSSSREELYTHLINLLNAPNELARFRGYCLQHLSYEARDTKRDDVRTEIVGEMVKALNDPSHVVRSRALRGLTVLDEHIALEKATQWFLDASQPISVRHTAIHTIGHFKADANLPGLRDLARIGPWLVRRAAIAVLGDFRDDESRAIFEAALNPQDPDYHRLKRAAELALKKLAPHDDR